MKYYFEIENWQKYFGFIFKQGSNASTTSMHPTPLNVHQEIWKKIPRKVSKMITLLHDNARPHTENLSRATLATMGSKIMNQPPYSLDLAPIDFHLFGLMKVHVGQIFQADDGLKHSVLN
jgi:hypothetical protein